MVPANSELELYHETLACSWARDHGWLTPKLQWVGQTGWPDRTFMRDGVIIFIEFKRPRGGRRSKKQEHWLEEIQKMGFHAFFCKTAVEAIKILEVYE